MPYAMKPYFEELERLQKEGIISPVEYSQWASGAVPVASGAVPVASGAVPVASGTVPVARRETKDVRL